jgi:non-ribosomal peptide synthetase component E (peptide arylation enzyme)
MTPARLRVYVRELSPKTSMQDTASSSSPCWILFVGGGRGHPTLTIRTDPDYAYVSSTAAISYRDDTQLERSCSP